MQKYQRGLYLLVLLLGFAVVIVAMGGGLFSQDSPWYLQWQHQMFYNLCHQIPERSFWFNGQPMAVCSRCIGIYAGFLGGWILLPVLSRTDLGDMKSVKKGILFVLLLNIFDIVGSVLGFWENTLVSRLALGILLGSSTALIFLGDFFNITIKSKESHHGRISAADVK